jgi:hypothetical protein
MAYNTTRERVSNSEADIFAYANEIDVETLPNYVPEENDRELELTEGWDGDNLPDSEQIARILNDDPDDPGNDRPLQLAEDQRYGSEIAGRDELISEYERQIAELRQLADPGYQARMQQQRDELAMSVIANPEATLDHIAGLHSQLNQVKLNRVNASMGAAHAEHGAEFERAYKNLTSNDPANPAACNLVQSIYNDPDPGRALMDWHSVSGGHTPRAMGANTLRGVSLPSLNTATSGGRAPRSGGHSEGWGDGGFGSDGEEADIFRHASR